MNPEELLAHRFAALQRQDYQSVYSSYHPEAPFLQSFPDSDSYVCFARQELANIEVRDWRSLGWRQPTADQIEHLLVMELVVDGIAEHFYELALLLKTSGGWRYHSAQKLSSEDYSGPPEQLDFCHFDQVAQKISY